MRRLTSIFGVMLLVGSMVGLSGCSTTSLHPSFGQLYRDVNMAQLGAHPAHEPTVRGKEIQSIIERHDGSYSSQPGGGGGGSSGGTSMKTAGVSPLH